MGRGVEPLASRPTPARTPPIGSKDSLMPRKTHPTTPALRPPPATAVRQKFLPFRGAGLVSCVSRMSESEIPVDIYATFLVAAAFRQVVGVQTKHFQPEPKVGVDVARQLIRGIEEGPERVTLGMVITSGDFSPEAVTEAERYEGIPIELVDGEQFAGLIVVPSETRL